MESIVSDIKTWRFWERFLSGSFSVIGALTLILEVLNLFVTDLPISGWPLFALYAAPSIAWGCRMAWPRPIRQEFDGPKTSVEIVKGDLFDEDCNIVIGTCDTFDTSTPDIIAKSSIQGQALERLYGGDVKRLDSELNEALEEKPILSRLQKPGKVSQYGIGTIATLRRDAHRVYFLAYSTLNSENVARSTPGDVWRSLESLWTEISRTANGSAVAIPVIGGGQSRLSPFMPAQDSIRLMILSFMFASRREKVCDELRMVVRPDDYDRLDRLELQAFLSSLRRS